MEPLSQRRYRIVIALDRSEYAEVVLEHGLDQASRHDRPDLHLVTVVPSDEHVQPASEWLATMGLEGLDAFRAGRPDWRTRLHVCTGDPVEEIAGLVGEIDADLLVIGHYHHRDVAQRLVEASACPTLVVGVGGHETETEPSCRGCAQIREESEGERWFCAEHSGDRARLTSLLPWSGVPVHGGW